MTIIILWPSTHLPQRFENCSNVVRMNDGLVLQFTDVIGTTHVTNAPYCISTTQGNSGG
jgi:hypothetical protein